MQLLLDLRQLPTRKSRLNERGLPQSSTFAKKLTVTCRIKTMHGRLRRRRGQFGSAPGVGIAYAAVVV